MKYFLQWVLVWLAMGACVSGSAEAQKKPPKSKWVGQRVMTVREAPFKLPGKEVTKSDLCEIMTVDLEKGSWLWVIAKNGWISKKDVVPVDEAIDYFTAQIRKKPTAEKFFTRGMAWFRQGRYYVAAGDFKNAIKIAPAPGYFNARGEAWRRAGENQRALADFNQAIKRGPKFASPYNNRGLTLLALGRYEEALQDFDQAIKLDDKFRLAYFNRGLCQRELGQLDEALEQFNTAIEIDGSEADAFNARGNIWLDKGDIEKAAADYAAAIKRNQQFAPAYFNRGHLHKLRGEYAAALADYQRAIKLDDKYAPAYNGVAWLSATCPDAKYRDGQRAVEYAERARQIGGGEVDSFIGTLAAAQAELGDFEQANQLLERAIELDAEAYRDVREQMQAAFRANKPYRESATQP